jgi:hypothetical protein
MAKHSPRVSCPRYVVTPYLAKVFGNDQWNAPVSALDRAFNPIRNAMIVCIKMRVLMQLVTSLNGGEGWIVFFSIEQGG